MWWRGWADAAAASAPSKNTALSLCVGVCVCVCGMCGVCVGYERSMGMRFTMELRAIAYGGGD